jgi:ribokinase
MQEQQGDSPQQWCTMARQSPRICVVGSSNIDLTFRTTRLPRPGETLAAQSFQMGFGGKGANQAVMAARLGAQVTMITKVGSDVFGDQTIANYRQHGIDRAHVFRDPQETTGVAAVVVDDAAQNYILLVPGSNRSLMPADVRQAAQAIAAADVLLSQLEIPLESSLEAFRIARAAGVRTILNPAPAADLPDEILRLTDLCVPNETELEFLANGSVANKDHLEEATRRLLQRGPGKVIVTLGKNGALLMEAGGISYHRAPTVPALDTTGAGDAFIGSLAVAWAQGMHVEEAIRRANLVAALSVTRLGTQAAFPSLEEVEAFCSKQGVTSTQ